MDLPGRLTRIRSFTNCSKSRSPVIIFTPRPFSTAWYAIVPRTSSASAFSFSRRGISKASIISLILSICSFNSSGIFARVALYSGKISLRKVLPVSKATARYSGFSFSRSRSKTLINPKIAAVGSPFEVLMLSPPVVAMAKNVR